MAVSFTPRAVSLIAIAALGVGSFGSSVMREMTPPQSRAPGGVRALGSSAPVTARAERLRQHVVDPPLPGRGRNPFVYGSRVRPWPSSSRDRSTETETAIAAPAPPPVAEAPALPVFRLSGIAADVKDGETLLTAIVIDNGSMVFVKNGDKLSNGYSVVRVDEMSVTLIDANGVTQTIRLP